ncbi:MAG: hypothetical protein QNK23_00665 [Crocinitomicaceae bacterium]|nr:hypothetical protein [Crocinitomicaceae bacterium]
MKKIAILLMMGFYSLSSFGGNNPGLVEEISSGMNLDLSTIVLDKYEADFVEVTFTVVNGEIKIRGLRATQYELRMLVVKKLVTMKIESDYDEETIYKCKFTFEKI